MRKKLTLAALLLALQLPAFCWGFFAHQKINYYAVFLLPPQLLTFYKPHIDYLSAHAVDPDKRRYLLPEEGARHYIDIDWYGPYPYADLPRRWDSAVARFGADTLQQHGVAPWWIEVVLARLTTAFREKDAAKILKLSAELGHYVADAHVPLHASSNHNGQLTGQLGIHAFWESRVPELLADNKWDFFLPAAAYIEQPGTFIWKRVLQSAAAADTVLQVEKSLSENYAPSKKFAFEERNGKAVRQYAAAYTTAYDAALHGMVERRMQAAVVAVASLWFTAWVNAGQPNLAPLSTHPFSLQDSTEAELLNKAWRQGRILGRWPE